MAAEESVRRVLDALERHGSAAEVRAFPQPVPTAAAAAAALGCDVGAIANSLVFVADAEPLLVIASGAHRVDTGRVARLIGASTVRRADAAFVLAMTGQRAGGVAPVGHAAPIPTVIDVWLAKYDRVWAGAGDENTVLATTFDELVRMTGGVVGEVG